MADWIRTYINAIDTAVKSGTNGLNVKLAEIDNTLDTISDDFVFKARQPFTQARPMFHQFILPSSFSEEGYISGYDDLEIQHYTGVRSYDDESSGLLNSVFVYWEAMIKAIYNTATNPGQLAGSACLVKPIQAVFNEEDPENKIAKEAGVIWRIALNEVNLQE